MSTDVLWKDGLSGQGGYDRYGHSPYWSVPDGLEILVEADWAGDYEFEQIVVWRKKDSGELRAAADTGCSCPSPFGDLTWDGMKPIGEVDDLRSLVESDAIYSVKWDDQDMQLAAIKEKVHRALRDALASPSTLADRKDK